MTRREKTEFILQQVSLCIQKGDWTQAGILSRKISTRYFTRKPKKSEVAAHLVNLAWNGLAHLDPKPRLVTAD